MNFYFNWSCLFRCEKMPICNYNILICFHQWYWYKIINIWCHVKICTWVLNPICQLQAISKIFSRTFCIGRHTCHRYVYILWLVLIYTVVQCLIYSCWSVRTSFRIFRVPVNLISWSVQFQKICDELILRSTSEACIWFQTITLSVIFIRVAWI